MARGCKVYFWSEAEKDAHNTERHQLFKNELYGKASWSKAELQIELAEFKKRHPELFEKNNNKEA